MILGDTSIVIQNVFGITPKALNPINMIFDVLPTDKCFGMINRMMFPVPFQGLVAPKGIGVIDRPFAGLRLDVSHQFVGTHRFHAFSVDTIFPLQEPEYDAFACGGSSTFSLPLPTKVRLIQFDFAFELAPFQFSQMEQGFSQTLVDARDDFDIDPQILRQPIGRLPLVKALQDRNFSTQTTQTFALPTELTFHIPATGVQDLKGTTKNTLATPQKVGRTTKNCVSSSAHAPVLAYTGYETP